MAAPNLEPHRFTHSVLNVHSRNYNDLISSIQTAEGAMQEVASILQRMRDLAFHSFDSSTSRSDRIAIHEEIAALSSGINHVAETASYGGTKLLDGTYGSQPFQIGEGSGDTVVLTLGNIRSDSTEMSGKIYVAERAESSDWVVTTGTTLTLDYTVKLGEAKSIAIHAKLGDHQNDVAAYINVQSDHDLKAFVGEDGKLQLFASTQAVAGEITIGGDMSSEIGFGAAKDVCVVDVDVTASGGGPQAMAVLEGALKAVDSQLAALRTVLNYYTNPVVIDSQANIDEDLALAHSRIKDTDFAKESTAMTKSQILAQAAASVLAYAKETPSGVLSILQ